MPCVNRLRPPVILVAVLAVAAAPLAGCARMAPMHGAAHGSGGGTTATLQPGADDWRRDPHMRSFYDTVVAAFAAGPDKVDEAALEAKSIVIFRDFAVSKGMNPDAMQDHLKLIPKQMIRIAREDPAVLKDYDAFVDALFGPK